MQTIYQLHTPLSRNQLSELRCGDFVELTGVIYTARDAAHARMAYALSEDMPLPFDIAGQVIYYAGPAPAKPGMPIGSCGPTTAGRMDIFTPDLLDCGLMGMLGKGPRSKNVVDARVEHGAVYFAAVGGAAAITAKCITSADVIAYEDLGPEAIRRLEVVRYPCIVAIDSLGKSIYEEGPAKYKRN